MKKLLVFSLLVPFFAVAAGENCLNDKKTAVCDKKLVQERVEWACKLVTEKGKEAIPEINTMRYDCCNENNYVWINTLEDKPFMVVHPIKPKLNGTDISENEDPDKKKLFVEFVKAVKAKPKGDWVSYRWTKGGEADPTPKESWVKECKPKGEKISWVVGSGTWK